MTVTKFYPQDFKADPYILTYLPHNMQECSKNLRETSLPGTIHANPQSDER